MVKKSYTKIPQQEEFDSSRPKISLFSYITFSWLSSLLKTAKERPLRQDDLTHSPGQTSTQNASQEFIHLWKEQLTTNNPQLWKVLVKSTHWGHIFGLCFVTCCCRILQPVFLNFMLEQAGSRSIIVTENNSSRFHNQTMCTFHGCGSAPVKNLTSSNEKTYILLGLYAFGLAIATLVISFAKPHIFLLCGLESSKAISGFTTLVYKKILSSKPCDLGDSTSSSGHVLNLVSKDIETLQYIFAYAPYLLLAPVQVLTVAFLLWRLVGIESVVSIGYLATIILCNFAIARILQHIRLTMIKRTDLRLKLVCDVITGVRVIKMNVWETLMERLIGQARRKELKAVFRSNILRATFFTFATSFTNTASFFAITTLLYTGHTLTARSVFTLITFISINPESMERFWYAVEHGANASVSLKRIQCFLLHERDNGQYNNDLDVTETDQLQVNKTCQRLVISSLKGSSIPKIILSKACSKQPLLNEVDLQFSGSTLVAVIGKIGCGKSSLLNIILGELSLSQGRVLVKGTIAFVPQTAWMFSGTIRDNILFGSTFDKKKYHEVIRACALDTDFHILPHGDMTYVGERGVRLSGGQRARVNLARAAYYGADIYLLDDPLSAIDSKVGRHVFEECIMGLLSNRLRVLVTHHVHYLKYVDQIVIMENGRITEQGTYDEIQLSDESLEKIMSMRQNGKTGAVVKGIEEREKPLKTVDEETNNRMEEEERHVGKISYKTYWKYIRSGSSITGLVILLFLGLVSQCSSNGAYFWLSHWTKLPPKQQHSSINFYIYSGLACCSFAFSFLFTLGLLTLCLNASRQLHNRMLSTILRCPIRFFDTNPPGRILNRFSRDTCIMDDILVEFLVRFVIMLLTCIFDIAMISVTNPVLIIATFPLIYFTMSRVKHYLQASREVERLLSISGSPLYEHFVQTIEGASVIRAFNGKEIHTNKIYRYRDTVNKALVMLTSFCGPWLMLRLNVAFAFFIIFVVVISLPSQQSTSLGLLVFYAIKLTTMLEFVLSGGIMENAMTSVERIIHYIELQRNPDYEIEALPPHQWPKTGALSFNHVTLTYYPGAPHALKGINLNIQSGEKIGIVGRTGAGKSSVMSALFRLPQSHSGSIVIDEVVIENLNVQDSRRAIGCIPQDPFLFTESLRFNLDPTGNCQTSQLWSVLDQVHMKSLVESLPEGLEYVVKEGGSNFSVGQRQLICLARALLQNKRIIVLDEATAHVDFTTDRLIQDTIKYKLKGQTVLAIAHRLDTVLDYDRVVVIDEGRVVETGQPGILMNHENSVFGSMYQTYVLSHSTSGSNAL